MGCRPSRRSTGRVGDFQNKRKNNNTYSYLKEVSDQGIVKESFQSTGNWQPSSKKDKKRETSKEFNSFSTTSKTYFKPGLRSSKITVRLSTDGSVLEIEEFELEPPNFTKSKDTDEDSLLKTRRASAPVFKFEEGKKCSLIHPFQMNNKSDRMKIKENLIQIHRVDSLRAPLASEEGDSISEDEEFDIANSTIIAECEINLIHRDAVRLNETYENLRTTCCSNENRIFKCQEGNFERPHHIEHSHLHNSDNECPLCGTEKSLCTQIDNHCQRELSTENKIVFRDSETNAYEVLDKSLSGTLSSAFQLSADICKMKFNRNDVGPKDKAKLEEDSGYNDNKVIMNAFMDHNSDLGRNFDTEYHLSLSDIKSQTLKPETIDITQSFDELKGATPPDYSMNFPSNSVLEFKFQNGDNYAGIDRDDINCEDQHPSIVSPHMSDCEESMTYTSANSDFLCSDDEEFSIPLCPCGDDTVVYSDHKVKHMMTLLG